MSNTALPSGGRHRAPDTDQSELLTTEQIASGHVGRHAEPEWARTSFDALRDDVDAFDWLGFEAAQE